jgi:hypothetical protein
MTLNLGGTLLALGGNGGTYAGGGGGGRVMTSFQTLTASQINALFAAATVTGGSAGINGAAGVITVQPELALVPSGQSLTLFDTLPGQTGRSDPRVELRVRDLTVQSGGSANLAASGGITGRGTLRVDGTGRFDLGDFDQSVASLAGDGQVTMHDGVLTVGFGDGDSSFSGTITTTGTGDVVQNGLGILTLGGNAFVNAPLVVATGALEVEGADARVRSLFNGSLGQVRIGPGQRLRAGATAAGGVTSTNSGVIEVVGSPSSPATLEAGALTNSATGMIAARNAVLRNTLSNSGTEAFSFGSSDVFGDTTNNAGGKIIVSGNADVTFWNDLTNNAGATVQVSEGSTAVFFGNVTNNGTFSGGGTKFFEGGSTGVLGALETTGSTVVEAGAAVTAEHVREASLTVRGAAQVLPSGGGTSGGTSRVGALDVAAGGTLDLTDNKLIVAGGDLGTFSGSIYTGITGWVQQGRDGGAWDGSGIVTSSAVPGSNFTTLGVALADDVGKVGQTFGGLAVQSGDVLVMYTYGGDANLDGKINIDDYGRIDANVGFNGSVHGWYNGDFNYDGSINIDDYGIIDSNIGIQGPSLAAGASIQAVPEPCSLAGLVLGTGLALGGRRRRRRGGPIAEK